MHETRSVDWRHRSSPPEAPNDARRPVRPRQSRPNWEQRGIQQEDSFEELPVIGCVPAELNGLYVRNGPNNYFPPDWRYHAYDGDGMLHVVRFRNGKVSYRNRWIATSALLEEKAAGRALWNVTQNPSAVV
ncbi:hypothetical protein BOC43_28650 [Burkholderia pseudomallei]|nr:hypothetical protein BOC43_28650 [Burkholderia pseudomallei]